MNIAHCLRGWFQDRAIDRACSALHRSGVATARNLAGRLALIAAFVVATAQAQSPGRASLEGRVLNADTGTYMNNVRVEVVGAGIETRTNQDGVYRLGNLPAGTVTLRASHMGMGTQTGVIDISAGGSAEKNFTLSLAAPGHNPDEPTLALERMVVEATVPTAQAAAINEQRMAPNIKNVVMLEEVGDLADGNVGEYLKYTPGVSITFGPQNANALSIRGMPPTGTLVTLDGAEFTSPSEDRDFDLGTSAAGNVDRVEVTKVPTPDLPANAVGGAVNIITKSGLSQPRRKVTLNTFLTYNSLEGIKPPSLGHKSGTDSVMERRRIQPGFDLSYVQPINPSLAVTMNAGYSYRYNDMEYMTPTWNTVTGVQTQSSIQVVQQTAERRFVAGAADWKLSRQSALRVNVQHFKNYNNTRQSVINTIFGTGATGDADFTQGAATGVGTLRQVPTWGNRVRGTTLGSLRFNHEGDTWKFNVNATASSSWDERQDMEDGFFRSLTNADRAQLVLRADNLGGVYSREAPTFTAWNRQGVQINPSESDDITLNGVTSQPNRIDNEMQSLMGDISRDFNGRLPFKLKAGAGVNRMTKDMVAPLSTWTFSPPGGASARLAGNYDFVNESFSASRFWQDTFQLEWLSPAKVYDLYRQHPEYFVLNEANAHISAVSNSKYFEEVISHAYVRGDLRAFNNRLWIVAGLRFERTHDKGRGPLDDISATYRRDAAGNLLRDAMGRLIPISTDALTTAKLRYVERGATADRSYDGYYPSLNLSYNFTEKLQGRLAYARTIGRPPLTSTIPGVTITDPALAIDTRRVTIINSGLKPWSADNFDLSLELYDFKGATIIASAFRKNVADFFGSIELPATPELLEELGLAGDLSDYEIVTTRNVGSASITGIELSWRQSLKFLPGWARGFQVFVTATKMDRSGPNADDFAPFSAENASWGVAYLRKGTAINLNVAYSGEVFTQWVAPNATILPGTYQALAPKTTIDLTFNQRLTKHLSVYGSLRNLDGSPKRTIRTSPDSPEFVKPRLYQEYGTMVTLGLRTVF